MDPIISNHLLGLEFGELQVFNNMGVIPLFSSVNGTPHYLTLKEALEKNLLAITEVSKEGAVPELKVLNRAEIPVLLLDGEELAGAKQNRVLNTTILLQENSETIIPVSCTEHGRWAYATREFLDSGNIMNRRVRSEKISSVSRSLKHSQTYRSDQRAIWDGIAQFSMAAEVHSETGAMKDVFVAKENDLKGYLDAFQYVPDQKGIFVLVNGMAVGFDILSLISAYEKIHPKMVKSYAMDALLQKGERADNGSVEKARKFVEEAQQCKEEKFKSVGHGWDHRYEGPTVVGSALVHEEKVIHMAFFRIGESEKVGRMSPASRRRGYRI